MRKRKAERKMTEECMEYGRLWLGGHGDRKERKGELRRGKRGI